MLDLSNSVDRKDLDWTMTSIDSRGKLRVIENGDLPFVPVRHFFVFDVPNDASRGAHAHFKCHQMLFVLVGSLQCRVIDKSGERIVSLSPSSGFLYLPPKTWAEQFDFKPETIMGCLASDVYDAKDYIHDFNDFLEILK